MQSTMNYCRPGETGNNLPPATVRVATNEHGHEPVNALSVPPLPFGVIITATEPEFTSWSTLPSQDDVRQTAACDVPYSYTLSIGNFVPDPFEELEDTRQQIAEQHQQIVALRKQLETSEANSEATTKSLRAEIARLADIAITALYDLDHARILIDILEDSNRRFELQSTTDHLTQLHNRPSLENEFNKHDKWAGVFMTDVDRFKAVNDLFGHPIGDQVLETVSRETRYSIRDEDTDILGRIGGDEFMGLIAMPESNEQASEDAVDPGKLMDDIAKRISENVAIGLDKLLTTLLKEPEFKDDIHKSLLLMVVFSRLGISVGTITYSPDMNYQDMYKKADDLMLRIKKDRHTARESDPVNGIIEKALASLRRAS